MVECCADEKPAKGYIRIMKWANGKDKIRGDYEGERAKLKPVKKYSCGRVTPTPRD